MKTYRAKSQSLLALVIVAMLAVAPAALAVEESDVPLAPGSESADQVLEIPQQCDKDAVAVLCDRSDSGAESPAQGADSNGSNDALPDSDPGQVIGSLQDYQNQQETTDPAVVYYVPVPVYVPVYPLYRTMPAPRGVPTIPTGPHYLKPLPYRYGRIGGGFTSRR